MKILIEILKGSLFCELIGTKRSLHVFKSFLENSFSLQKTSSVCRRPQNKAGVLGEVSTSLARFSTQLNILKFFTKVNLFIKYDFFLDYSKITSCPWGGGDFLTD